VRARESKRAREQESERAREKRERERVIERESERVRCTCDSVESWCVPHKPEATQFREVNVFESERERGRERESDRERVRARARERESTRAREQESERAREKRERERVIERESERVRCTFGSVESWCVPQEPEATRFREVNVFESALIKAIFLTDRVNMFQACVLTFSAERGSRGAP
jgi:hypothetical protein